MYWTKILNILCAIIVVFIPLVFSHLYFLGWNVTLYDLYGQISSFSLGDFSWSSAIEKRFYLPSFTGYERVKVTIFLISSFLLFLCFFACTKTMLFPKKLPLLYIFLTVAILSIFFAQYLHALALDVFLFGSMYKMHGVLMVWGLLCFYFALRLLPSYSLFFRACFVGFILVLLYGYFQILGIDPNADAYVSRLDTARVLSTLGNPNYLAGYLLLFLPVISRICSWWKYFLWVLVGFLLLTTKSYIGIGLTFCYLLYLWIPKKKYLYTTFLVLPFLLIASVLFLYDISLTKFLSLVREVVYHFVFYPIGTVREVYLEHLDIVTLPEKIRWFLARPFFWSTGAHLLVSDMKIFFFWIGPDQLPQYYETFRHPFLMHDILEHTDWVADRTHNFFLDIWVHWWLLPFLYIVTLFTYMYRIGSARTKEILLLFSIFFFFNIPVVVHYIILMGLILSDSKISAWKSQN